MSDTLPVRHLTELPEADFVRDYYRGNRPLVIRGAVNHWPALRRWNRDYFESLLGERVVPVDYSHDGFMTYTALGKERNTGRAEMGFLQAAAEIHDPAGRRCYLRNVSVPKLFPELLADFDPPALIGDPERITMNHFWYGGSGCVTALHFDWTSNFLAQVKGRKQVTLFSPDQTPYLYPAGDGPTDWIDLREHSLLDIEHPDYDRFPLFREARPLSGVLEPGDMLWLPPNWWHQMKALEVSISLNFWWTPHLDQVLFMDDLVTKMPDAYAAGVLEEFLWNGTETRDFSGLIHMAERARELGLGWAATLIAAAALEQDLRQRCQGAGVEEPGGAGTQRMEELNAALAAAGEAGAVNPELLAEWRGLVERAMGMDADKVDEREVATMVQGVREALGR